MPDCEKKNKGKSRKEEESIAKKKKVNEPHNSLQELLKAHQREVLIGLSVGIIAGAIIISSLLS